MGEKETKVHNDKLYLWVAVDLDRKVVIVVSVSKGRSNFEVFFILKKVGKACLRRKPLVFIDGGTWYPWVL